MALLAPKGEDFMTCSDAEFTYDGDAHTMSATITGSDLSGVLMALRNRMIAVSDFHPATLDWSDPEAAHWLVNEVTRRSAGRPCASSIAWEQDYAELRPHRQAIATRAGKESVRRKWANRGHRGAHWLVQRVRRETDTETALWVASLLAGAGERAMMVVLNELEAGTSPMATDTLLRAIGTISIGSVSEERSRLRAVLQKYLVSPDGGTRELAIEATAHHFASEARSLLTQAAGRASGDARRELERAASAS